jgi:hypothetical protein
LASKPSNERQHEVRIESLACDYPGPIALWLGALALAPLVSLASEPLDLGEALLIIATMVLFVLIGKEKRAVMRRRQGGKPWSEPSNK